jgi:hypothetical protein
MTKISITRMWIAGLIVLIVGLVAGGISLGLMLTNGGTWTPSATGNGSEFVPSFNGYFWTTVWFMIAGFSVAVIGGIVQMVAWIGALISTYQLEDKAWFIVLLAGGLLGLAFGLISFATMVAYLVAGPDGAPVRRSAIPMPDAPLAPPVPQPSEYAHVH